MSVTNYPASIPVFIGTVVDEVRTALLSDLQEVDDTIQTITYMYGNIKELETNLKEMSKGVVDGVKKNPFPAILLIEDITVNRSNTGGFFGSPSLEIVIVNKTKKEYKSAERETINFAPILRPIYYKFLEKLSENKYAVIKSARLINHNMTEKKYWGVDDNSANFFTKYVDGIHITNMNFPINWTYCTNPITDII